LGTFIMLFPANFFPLMSVDVLGMHRRSLLMSGVVYIWNEHLVWLAACIFLFVVLLPFVRFGLLSLALIAIVRQRYVNWTGPVFRWALWLDMWAMPDVYLIAGFVGYSRVAARLTVTVRSGGYCFIVAAFLAMITRAVLDKRTAWRALPSQQPASEPTPVTGPVLSCTACDMVLPAACAGRRCPRCRARLALRKADSQLRPTALIIAAFLLNLPANLYPMNVTYRLGHRVSYRIYDGIRDLFHAGLAPLGILIFFTSIAIPMIKICGLGWFLLSVRRRSQKHLVLKTRLYRLIDELGRWSCIDPFIISVFVPLMSFGNLINSVAARGALAFIMVVILTMLASLFFDPRSLWDAAESATAEGTVS
jgi:paraquat-inducible protein A